MKCKHPDESGWWVSGETIWHCFDCGKFLKPRYYCTNCETDEWITCKVDEEIPKHKCLGPDQLKRDWWEEESK